MSWNTCQFPECESYTARPDGELCETHRRANAKDLEVIKKQFEKRAEQIAQQKIKNAAPRAKPNKVSEKRKETNKEYFKLVEQFKKDNPECKAKVNEYCTTGTEDVHHKKGRGKYLMEVSSFLPVCRSCHSCIEAHPKEAKEKGWSESRLTTVNQTV